MAGKTILNDGWIVSLPLCLVVCLATSCSKAGYRQNQAILSQAYKQQNYKYAKELVVGGKFLPDQDDALLKNLEIGMAYLSNENACIAVKFFDKASNIAQEQYTKSLKDDIASGVDATDGIYYGQTYEKSLLNFYKSLANYKVYSEGICHVLVPKTSINQDAKTTTAQQDNKMKNNQDKNDKKNEVISDKIDVAKMVLEPKTLNDQEKNLYLSASKASVMYWDSWMKGRKIEANDQLYMDDLLLKLWGAFIHEQSGSSSDIQIAKQLYKDAINIAQMRYAIYKTFNTNNTDFIKHIKEPETRTRYLDKENTYFKDVELYAKSQLKRLDGGRKANFAILLQDNVVREKLAQKAVHPLNIATLALAGNVATFAAGLLSDAFEFEKPVIQQYNNSYKYYYSLWQGKKKVLEYPIVLAEPVADMAYENLQEKIDSIVLKTQAKVTAQMVVGILAAWASYEGMSNVNDMLAMTTAMGVFAGYSQLIKNAGIVDTRQWVSLPVNIFMATNNVKSGKYTLKIVRRQNALNVLVRSGLVNTKQEQLVYQTPIEIGKKTTFVDVRL